MGVNLPDQDGRPLQMPTERVCVCLCTKDRNAMLLRCLRSLLNQRIPEGSLDVHLIVVDNSVDASERNTIALRQGEALPIIYVHEPTPGIPNARNAGLTAASALSPDWIAFIDDDEIAPPDWIARLHATALHYRVDVVSGKVVQFPTFDEAQSAAENWTSPDSFGNARRRLTCPTSNVIFRASILSGEPSLRFDESMQHGGSDVEFFMRAGQRGARIAHVKDATVFEEYPASRKTVDYECRRAFRVGTTTNYRYIKNYGNLPGAALLVGRVITKTATAVGSAALGLMAYPFARSLAERSFGRGVRSAATALGFVGPLFGIKPGRYW